MTQENHSKMEQILSKIKEYNRIILTRHIWPDGDAIGSSKGLAEILRSTFPQKEIYVQSNDSSEYLSFLGPDDAPIDPELYKDSLCIILDTSNEERISNSYYKTAKETIKIDHHVDATPFGDISWVEDQRSSASEMVALFYQTFQSELKVTKEAARYIYTGIVTDSGRFRYESTKGETLRLASILLDVGIDTEEIYSNLYLKDFDNFKFQSYVYDKLKMTENGVVYIFVDSEMKKKFNLSNEKAGDVISLITEIKKCIVQLAFIQLEDGKVRIRLRSRYVPIRELAQKYGGGGHEFASGAVINDQSEIQKVVEDADQIIAEFKENHKNKIFI